MQVSVNSKHPLRQRLPQRLVMRAGMNWRKLAPVPILALVTEYCERPDEQVVVLFQILAAEINFGYKFQTVKCASLSFRFGFAAAYMVGD